MLRITRIIGSRFLEEKYRDEMIDACRPPVLSPRHFATNESSPLPFRIIFFFPGIPRDPALQPDVTSRDTRAPVSRFLDPRFTFVRSYFSVFAIERFLFISTILNFSRIFGIRIGQFHFSCENFEMKSDRLLKHPSQMFYNPSKPPIMNVRGPETGGQKRIFTGLAPERDRIGQQASEETAISRQPPFQPLIFHYLGLKDIGRSARFTGIHRPDSENATPSTHPRLLFLFSTLLDRMCSESADALSPRRSDIRRLHPRRSGLVSISRPIALKFRR